MMRQRMFRLSMLVPLIGGLMVLLVSALPSSTAYACLPCNCPELTSVNCFGPYALYTPSDDEGCSLDIWVIKEDGQGEQAILQTPEDLADLPDAEDIEGYILVEEAYNGFIALYKLETDRYQINVGPNTEGKVHTIDFVGCPAEDVYESTFIVGS